MQDCSINWLRKKGCRTDSQNCFCKLDGKELVAAVEQCKKAGCMRHMSREFDVAFWRDQVCAQGDINNYDEDAYKGREKTRRTVRIVVTIFVGFFALCYIVTGLLAEGGGGVGAVFVGLRVSSVGYWASLGSQCIY
jgi:hypothetical protein